MTTNAIFLRTDIQNIDDFLTQMKLVVFLFHSLIQDQKRDIKKDSLTSTFLINIMVY